MATSITINGGDSAHHARVTEESVRFIDFPDGVSRMISLTALQWEVYDKWTEITGWAKSTLADAGIEMANHARDNAGSQTFELDLRFGLSYLLDLMKASVSSVPLKSVNENRRTEI